MPQEIRRVFVEKKENFAVEARMVFDDLKNHLGIKGVEKVRLLNRYDVTGITKEDFLLAVDTAISSKPVDNVFLEDFSFDKAVGFFAVEYLPGQYDQRADSVIQSIKLIAPKNEVLVKTAKIFVLYGDISASELKEIKNYYINPIEVRETTMDKASSLELPYENPGKIERLEGFLTMSKADLAKLGKELGLAMDDADLELCQSYFKEEKRDPSMTEIRMLDTYWSDHCRHTTFNTVIDKVDIVPHRYSKAIDIAYDLYNEDRSKVYGDSLDSRPVTLMDIAVLAMKKLRAEGKLDDLEVSEEVNACSMHVPIEVDGKIEDWLVMFKNETHNHPTEIEPFGGAATCLGGGIRDPLSGRAYVHQAMRITGGGDPRTPIRDTLKGKLPQRKIALSAVTGYSSYGNQIGATTGLVKEFYHERFVAKRMELGALVGAVPKDAVVREQPEPGDKIILLGGKTGRDGCGAATGSSKEHTEDSLEACGSEVQKGNASIERNMIRLFRDPKVTRLIKRCNDFGAGGVSVAVTELTDGVKINLDNVPPKYPGLNGTELAISESQERLALVVAEKDCAELIRLAELENLEATVIAEVTAEKRIVMHWQGDKIVDLSREFLNTNGVQKHTKVLVKPPVDRPYFEKIPFACEVNESNLKNLWLENLQRLEVCSQKGVNERFDTTVGRGTVLLPFGGKNQLTPAEGMVASIPAMSDKVNAATVMTYGYNPELACWSPFYGALYSVIESVCRATALGADPEKLRLSFQEYFEKMVTDENWGKPFAALLGAYLAQAGLDLPAVGGKDSMSGTFMDLHVPPTLASFAVGMTKIDKVVSSEFKNIDSNVVFLSCERDENELPDFAKLKLQLQAVHKMILDGKVRAISTVKEGGIAATVSIMGFGNDIGVDFNCRLADLNRLFVLQPAGFILEVSKDVDMEEICFDAELDWLVLGTTNDNKNITIGDTKICLKEAKDAWEKPLESVYPIYKTSEKDLVDSKEFKAEKVKTATTKVAKPRVFIPLFPSTNNEYDITRAFEAVGAQVDTFVVRTGSSKDIEESFKEISKRIEDAQIISLNGGYTAADEASGVGNFIVTMFKNPYVRKSLENFLTKTDGLVLGVNSGFQALVKLGLLPYGKFTELKEDSPTLVLNKSAQHIAKICHTKVISNLSPWFTSDELGSIHTIAISSGEGRFYADIKEAKDLLEKGQVATQYVDEDGNATMQAPYNPFGSVLAIEALTSPDGRILGKMGHAERYTNGIMKNIPGNKEQNIFLAGVKYFS